MLQESVQIARRKELYLELYPETKHGGDRKSEKRETNPQVADLISEPPQPLAFTADTASKTGKSRDSVERRAHIGTELAAVAEQLESTPIADNQKELLALAALPTGERQDVVTRLTSGEAKTVKEAKKQGETSARLEAIAEVLTDDRYSLIDSAVYVW